MGKIRVAAVFGGKSVEHEISLLSAKAVIKNMDPERFEPFPIFIDKSGSWRRAAIDSWLEGGELKASTDAVLTPSLDPAVRAFYEIAPDGIRATHYIDVIFPILHGAGGEDGSVQGLFDTMGIPYVGAPVLGSSVGMDKIVMKALFKEAGLPVTDYVWFYKHEWEKDKKAYVETIRSKIGFPCFVKSANLGSSVGIEKVDSIDTLEDAVRSSAKFSRRIIVEKAAPNVREIEVSVLGNDDPVASLPGEIVPHTEFYDYTAKYLEEGTKLLAPAELPGDAVNRFKEIAVKAYKTLDCAGMGRVDFFMDGKTGEIFLNEINTIPGFTRISMYPKLWEASGISFQELVTRLIELAIERHEAVAELERDYEGYATSDT